MHASSARPDVAASPGLMSGDSNGHGKKSQHSPWTASKPRKKTNRTQEAMDNYDEFTIVENDENQLPMAKAGEDCSADMQMLTDGMKALRVFRKASGVKGAVQLRQNRGNPLLASLPVNLALTNQADQDRSCLSSSFSSASMLFTGSHILHTAASCPTFLDGLQASLEANHATFKPSLPHAPPGPATCTDAPGIAPIAGQITPPSQSLSVSLHAGHSCEMPREVERLADLHALSADCTNLRPSHLAASNLQHRATMPHAGPTAIAPPTAAGTAAGCGPGPAAPPHLHQPGGIPAAGCGGDDGDDQCFMHVLARQLQQEQEDVWGGEDDFRIMTRPLRVSGAGDEGGRWSRWETSTPRTSHGGQLPFTTPRTSAGGAPATTTTTPRHATIPTGLVSESGAVPACPGSCSMEPAGQVEAEVEVEVHHYGRAGYCSGASDAHGDGAHRPRGNGVRRAPTPAGHLLGRTMADWDDDDDDDEEEEAGPEGREEQGRQASRVAAVLREDNAPSAPMRLTQRRAPHASRDTADCTPEPGGLPATPNSTRRQLVNQLPGHSSGLGATASGVLKAAAKQLLDRSTLQQGTPMFRARGAAAASPGTVLETPETAQRSGRRFQGGFLDSERRASRDSVARQVQEEAALANLMCDECDFCTPPHSPRGLGLPVWAHGSEMRSELRRTRSADDLMMSRDITHPLTCAGCDVNPMAASCQLHHPALGGTGGLGCYPGGGGEVFGGGGGGGGQPHYGMHPACSYDAGLMELAHAHGQGGVAAGRGGGHHHHHVNLGHASLNLGQHLGQGDDVAAGGWSLSSAFAYGEGSWLKGGRGGGSAGGAGSHSGVGELMHGEEEREVIQVPVSSLDTLDEFNAQLSLAAERGDQSRAERVWAELRDRCLLPDMRTLNMLMRCLCKGIIDPDAAEELMCEVCTLGGLQPNATTLTLLAEIRHRYEQLTTAHI